MLCVWVPQDDGMRKSGCMPGWAQGEGGLPVRPDQGCIHTSYALTGAAVKPAHSGMYVQEPSAFSLQGMLACGCHAAFPS